MEKTPSFVVQTFGNYILLDRIAVGGMAEIFKAKQSGVRGFEKIVVIKKILHHLGEDPEFVSMFEDEAKIAAQLNQANIVQIYELGEINDTLYIVMEYVEGKNLRDLKRAIDSKGIHFSIEQCIYVATEVLKGLDYAHRKTDSAGAPLQIIHRDMSPQNIVISYEGEVKILDFGIAKAASKVSKTEAGVLKGKFSYMSPEQASGREIGQTTDIYACGVILHEMLSSERLFRADTDMETLERVRRGVVPAPSEKNPLIAKDLDRIVLKALAREPEKRYQSAGEFLSDLIRFASDNQISYSSHDLSSFMKSIFEERIKSERKRLREALAEQPMPDPSSQREARTHIAFKSEEIGGPSNQAKRPAEDDRELTQMSRLGNKSPSYFFRFVILLFFGFSLIAYLWTRTFNDFSEPESITLPDAQTETDLPDEISEPTPPPVEFETETAEPDAPSIENILEEVKPPVPKPRTEKKPAILEEKKYGLIDVIAPFEGYAQLYIDDESYGSVPGPRARGIRLKAGKYEIRCETTDRIYKGEIQIKADSRIRVRCQELTETRR